MASKNAVMTVTFLDGKCLAFTFPRRTAESPGVLAGQVRKAIEQDRLALEADGDLYLIPMTSVKHITVSPAPDEMPVNVLKGAIRVG